MSLGNRIVKFWNKNVVLITGVGIIIGIHWMWDRLQHTSLVPEKDRKELPIIHVMTLEEIITYLKFLLICKCM